MLTAAELATFDLDNTENCLSPGVCDGCGQRERPVRIPGQLRRHMYRDEEPPAARLKPRTMGTPVGVYCMWLCPGCEAWAAVRLADPEAAREPWPRGPKSWPDAVHRVWQHCAHLGIDPDDMAAVLDDEAADLERMFP